LPLVLLILAHLGNNADISHFYNDISAANLLYSLLNDRSQVVDGREVVDDLGQDNQAAPDLDKTLALQTTKAFVILKCHL
jgi:hypothetical protein